VFSDDALKTAVDLAPQTIKALYSKFESLCSSSLYGFPAWINNAKIVPKKMFSFSFLERKINISIGK
jgi:hypothetical protein